MFSADLIGENLLIQTVDHPVSFQIFQMPQTSASKLELDDPARWRQARHIDTGEES